MVTEQPVKILRYHYGPTSTDPDSGATWCYACGGRVDFFGGHALCGCGAQVCESPVDCGNDACPYRPADARLAANPKLVERIERALNDPSKLIRRPRPERAERPMRDFMLSVLARDDDEIELICPMADCSWSAQLDTYPMERTLGDLIDAAQAHLSEAHGQLAG